MLYEEFLVIKKSNIKSVNTNKIWVTEDWFYVAAYGNFGDWGKATQRPAPENLRQ